jgi:hypothetical protein
MRSRITSPNSYRQHDRAALLDFRGYQPPQGPVEKPGPAARRGIVPQGDDAKRSGLQPASTRDRRNGARVFQPASTRERCEMVCPFAARWVDAKRSVHLSPGAGDRNVPAPFWSCRIPRCEDVCPFATQGPTARGHTSLGQRPRLRDGLISEGLKARSIGPQWRAPTGLPGSVRR